MGCELSHSRASAQQVTTQAPQRGAAAGALPEAPPAARGGGPEDFAAQSPAQTPTAQDSAAQTSTAETLAAQVPAAQVPVAQVVRESGPVTAPELTYDTLSRRGSLYALDGHVRIHYGDRLVEADHIDYDAASGDANASGHLRLSGGANGETLSASHGAFNLKSQTGRFYDVSGSVGFRAAMVRQTIYSNGNPFLFTGRMVVKTGPRNYDIYDGTVTSCQLPRPDWIFSAAHFSVDAESARARNSTFRLLNLPLVFLPYVTHPVEGGHRQAGILIPVLGQSSTKGFVLGETFYLPLGRSADLTVGAEYFSRRGYSQLATFRYRGLGDDFAQVHYTGLLDRQNGPLGTSSANQGGEDLAASGRGTFSPENRVAAQIEYLSSYVYREAFSESFNQAISTDITSVAYGVHQHNGYEAAIEADRYQGLKRVPVNATATTPAQAGQEIRIFHVPSFNVSSTEHRIGDSPFVWSLDSSAAGLKRVQPNFATGGVVERLDLHPQISLPLSAGGWNLFSTAGLRETLYSRSREIPAAPGGAPVQRMSGLGRTAFDLELAGRAPVLERSFRSPTLDRLLGGEVRHTIEPAVSYRYVTGVGNFARVLRFDDRDILSDTNELQYGATQRLFVHSTAPQSCDDRGFVSPFEASTFNSPVVAEAGVAEAGRCATHELLSWSITQKYFFNPTFGGAVQTGRRNIFSTTLDLSGVAFLTEPRNISPVVSRLRARASSHADLEWDADLDTGARRFTSNVFLLDLHQGSVFGGISYARLNAPGRSYVEGVSSLVADFNQLRFLLGYGNPTKSGLSVATSAGLDLDLTQVQYATVQTAYNWNCCGFSVEYRKYELGSVRNENAYRFNFTLANIGSAGNLRHADRLF